MTIYLSSVEVARALLDGDAAALSVARDAIRRAIDRRQRRG